MKKKRKIIRRLLGVGHPWFFKTEPAAPWPSALKLTTKDAGRIKGNDWRYVELNTCGTGSWQKVRVYLEWEAKK